MPHTCSLEVNVLRHLPIEVSVLSHAVGVPAVQRAVWLVPAPGSCMRNEWLLVIQEHCTCAGMS